MSPIWRHFLLRRCGFSKRNPRKEIKARTAALLSNFVQLLQLCWIQTQSRLPRPLKSQAGGVQDWKWQKQIDVAAIFGEGEWTLKCIFRRLRGVHTVLYESIISSMQEAQDTIIHSKVPPLSVQWELKSTCCQVQWHSCFPFAPVEPVSGGRANQSSLEITHFLLHNYKAASQQREEKRDVCMNFLSALWVQLLRNNATQKCQHFADVLANNIMSGTMALRFSALAHACNCNCQVSPPFALTFNSYLTWHTHGAGGAAVSLYRTHNLLHPPHPNSLHPHHIFQKGYSHF